MNVIMMPMTGIPKSSENRNDRRHLVTNDIASIYIQQQVGKNCVKDTKEEEVSDEILNANSTVHSSSYLSLIRFRMLQPCRIFYTSSDLLLFVRLSRHLPPSSPPHPSPKIYLAFLCFFGLSLFFHVIICPVFGVFLYVQNNKIVAL